MTIKQALIHVIKSYEYFIKEKKPRNRYYNSIEKTGSFPCPLCNVTDCKTTCPARINKTVCYHCVGYLNIDDNYTPENAEKAKLRIKELKAQLKKLK